MVSFPAMPSNSLYVPDGPSEPALTLEDGKAGRVVPVVQVRAADSLDAAQRVGTREQRVARHRSGGEIDRDAGRDRAVKRIHGEIETLPAVDGSRRRAAFEDSRCHWRLPPSSVSANAAANAR